MRQAFTLLELSIVLVIIGLLIGGIFVGQSLIHTAQLNAVISEFNRYQAATQNFKMQYQALPGDMNNATNIWGAQNATPATCRTTASTTTATCNGDGNGILADSAGSDELFRFWQHLANAKMIEGQYQGIGTVSTVIGATGGVSTPASKYPNAAWSVQVASIYNAGSADPLSIAAFATDYGTGHVFILGATNGGDSSASAPAFSPRDVWAIDKKVDDGMPAQGNVMVLSPFGFAFCTSASNNTTLNATYALTTTSNQCSIFFIAGF